MLFCAEGATDVVALASIVDAGKIRLGGACRLPVKTADTGKIRLGGACRLPVKTA
jgi:hypothetical protein